MRREHTNIHTHTQQNTKTEFCPLFKYLSNKIDKIQNLTFLFYISRVMADSGSGDDEKTPPPSRPGGGGGSGMFTFSGTCLGLD